MGGVNLLRHPLMTSITMDRKLEAEVRLLSVLTRAPLVRHDYVDADTLTSDEVLDIRRALMEVSHSRARSFADTSDKKDQAALGATTLILGDAGGASVDERIDYDDILETRPLKCWFQVMLKDGTFAFLLLFA
jgi:hypothetical protein